MFPLSQESGIGEKMGHGLRKQTVPFEKIVIVSGEFGGATRRVNSRPMLDSTRRGHIVFELVLCPVFAQFASFAAISEKWEEMRRNLLLFFARGKNKRGGEASWLQNWRRAMG